MNKVKNYLQLEQELRQLISSTHMEGREVVLFISGGSFLSTFESMLSSWLKSSNFEWEKITVTLTDERYNENYRHRYANYTHLRQSPVVKKAAARGMKLREILVQGYDLDQTTDDLLNFVKSVFSNKNVVSIALVGVGGSDGHVAGILPYDTESEGFFNSDLVVGYDASETSESNNRHKERVTLTFKALGLFDHLMLILHGTDDDRIQKFIVKGEYSKEFANSPLASLIKSNHKLVVFSDIQT